MTITPKITPQIAALALGAALLSAPVLSARSAPAKKKAPAKSVAKPRAPRVQNVVVAVDGSGYHPASVSVKAGVPVKMVFVSKGMGCANSIVVPSLGQRFRLKMGQQKAISFTPKKGQALAFMCSMDMFRGQAVAK